MEGLKILGMRMRKTWHRALQLPSRHRRQAPRHQQLRQPRHALKRRRLQQPLMPFRRRRSRLPRHRKAQPLQPALHYSSPSCERQKLQPRLKPSLQRRGLLRAPRKLLPRLEPSLHRRGLLRAPQKGPALSQGPSSLRRAPRRLSGKTVVRGRAHQQPLRLLWHHLLDLQGLRLLRVCPISSTRCGRESRAEVAIAACLLSQLHRLVLRAVALPVSAGTLSLAAAWAC